MSSAATATRIPFAAERHRLAPIARALAWEECRVGGSIALACTAVAVLLSITMRITFGAQGWVRPEGLIETVVLFQPLLLALMLVLNTANSGHLISGFSKRILWLPVPVPVAVAVTLGLRAFFVLLSATAIVAAARLLFDDGPAFTLVALFVVAYLLVQTIDWMRAAVSGLASMLVLSAVVSLPFVVLYHGYIITPVHWAGAANPAMAMAYSLAAFGCAYALSVIAVHATRVGRTTGIPEIWEWPHLVERKGRARLKPFKSPVTAQVWFELRRYGLTLPAGTIALTAIIVYFVGFFEDYSLPVMRDAVAYGVIPAFLVAAIAHGLRARVVDFHAARGKPGFQFVLALSSADGALARCIANAIVLIPTAFLVIALHIWLTMGAFIVEVVPGALELGVTSPREAIWLLLSRGLVLTLVAWVLMGAASVWMGLLIPALIAWTAALAYYERTYLLMVTCPPPAELSTVYPLYYWPLPVVTLCAFAWAGWRGWLGAREITAWVVVWLLAAWLMHRLVPAYGFEGWAVMVNLYVKALGGLAWGSLVVLPFLLLTLDITRKRHGTAWVRQAGLGSHSPRPRRPGAWALATVAALFIIWLGWPAEPAYRGILRANGAPMTYDELDAYYPAVPDADNRALAFLEAAERHQARSQALFADHSDGGIELEREAMNAIREGWYPRTQPMEPETWAAVEEYWHAITRHTVPELLALAQVDPNPARYPIDLREGHNTLLPHLAPLRQLARELSIDALYHGAKGDTERALASVFAISPIGESLRDEPILISQLVRMAIIRINLRAIEMLMAHAELDDAEIRSLDAHLQRIALPFEEGAVLYRPIIVERSMYTLDFERPVPTHPDRPSWEPLGPTMAARAIIQPPEAERMVLMAGFAGIMEALQASGGDFPAEPRRREQDPTDRRFGERDLAPFAFESVSRNSRAHMAEATLLMDIAIARTAIAAERYRREHGDWPATLDALVPAYIDAVPFDVMAILARQPVRHTVRDDGTFVVYSVGLSGDDHGGNPRTVDDQDTDDRVFEVHTRPEGASHEQ